ncbi:MAG: SCO family protein [Janthinobacterium sp.]
MKKTLTLLLAAALVAVLAGCGKPAAPKLAFKNTDVTGLGYAREFALTDHTGHPRTLADYKGKLVLMFFGYTQCPDVCPTTMADMAQVMQEMGPQAEQVQVLFVTVDPERDTPELLGEYMRAFDPSFLGLRTDPKATAQTAFNYKVFYRRVPSGSSYTMDHTAISYVLDTEGRMRLGLKHQLTGDECVQDIKTLMQSKYTL